MRHNLSAIARVLLGLAFAVFGLNFFLGFLSQPPPPAAGGAFLGALAAGKILAIVKTIELAAGLALVANRFAPLALTLLAPIEVGIVAYHAVFDPAGLAMPLVLVGLTTYLAWTHRAAFAPMLRARLAPAAPA